MNKIAGVVGYAPMTPAFFRFGGKTYKYSLTSSRI